MKTKFVLLSVVAAIALSACGSKETIIKEVLVTQPTNAPVETQAPYESDKYDRYLEEVYRFSAQARSWTEQELFEFGMTVCDAFDQGATLDSVLELFAEYSTGSYDDELFAGVLSSAVVFICPEHQSYVQSQLGA